MTIPFESVVWFVQLIARGVMMRRAFALVALFALTAVPVRGQGLEFSGGVNISELSGDAVREARNIGMNFGIDLVIPVGPVGLNLGADWSQRVSKRRLRRPVRRSSTSLTSNFRYTSAFRWSGRDPSASI